MHRTTPQIQRVFRDLYGAAKSAMDTVIAQQMCIRFNRPRRIYLDHLQIIAGTFGNMRQSATTNSTKAIDTDRDRHAIAPIVLLCVCVYVYFGVNKE